jgi:ubiquinol-cytochrome c reductase cytochrome c1 subunit
MIRKLTLTAITAMSLAFGGGAAFAAGGGGHVEDYAFSFEGPFGKFDQQQLQRGLKVYTEACAACHGLRYVPIRTLADPGGPGYTEDEVRAYAAEYFEVFDPELDDFRPATPADHFPTVSGDGMGPDLSLMAKARAGFHGPYGLGISQLFRGIGGAEYITSYLLGYTGEEDEVAGQFLYENTAYSSGWVQMAPQLFEGSIEYDDGTPATEEQMAKDVAAFLMWTAEPKMMARKQAGIVAVTLLILLTTLLYLANKKLWYPVKHGGKQARL